MSDEQPPRQLSDADLPEPLGHIFRMIERLAEQTAAGEDATQRKIEFILDQQAQLAVRVGQLSDTVDKLSGTVDSLSDTVDKLSGTVDKLSDKVDRTAGSITNLLAAAEIQAGEINDLTQAVRAVDERQRHTDERLNVLINTVERFISEGRNGKS